MSKQTVLIVDDVSDNVDILVELLHRYDLVTALDGQTALQVMEEEHIDLVLLDIMMPDMDGFEVCEKIKEQPQFAQIPIIFLSAKSSSEDIQKGFALGAVDYVSKPFNATELLARVQTHLKLRAYEQDLQEQVAQEVEKNKLKEQTIYAQAKQAALGEQLTHIAHQWKQPLSSLSSLNILQLTKLQNDIAISKEEQLATFDKIDTLVSFMAQTIDTFKDFYTASQSNSNFLMQDVLEKVLKIVSATLEYHNVVFEIDVQEEMMCEAEEREVMQAIFSIINNAVKIFHLRKIARPVLFFTITKEYLHIADNGGGIDEEVLETLFEPFVSATAGTGVGLFIAKEMIEKNGGIISAQNSANGAKFTIEFLSWEY